MYATADKLNDAIGRLIDGWCERRALQPLGFVLPAWLAVNGLTDGWDDLRTALRHTKALRGDALREDELVVVGKAIATLDRWVLRF